jgi:outer membrane protein assembly factor BamB
MKNRPALTILLAAAAATPACGDLQSNVSFAADEVAYTPDGTLVVFTNRGLVLFDDPGLATVKKSIPSELPSPDQFSTYGYSLSSDGTTAAMSFSSATQVAADTVISTYRVPSGEVLGTFRMARAVSAYFAQTAAGLVLSPHGDRLAVLAADASDNQRTQLQVVDPSTGAAVWTATGDESMPVWSPDSATLYATDGELFAPDPAAQSFSLQAFDAATGIQKWSQPWPLSPLATAMVGDGTMLAGLGLPFACLQTGDCPAGYPFWSAGDGTLAAQLPPVTGTWSFLDKNLRGVLRCSATDDVCATAFYDNVDANGDPTSFAVRIYRPDGTVVATFSTKEFTTNVDVALSPDGQYLAVVAPLAGSDVRVYRIADGTVVGARKLSGDVL